MKPRTRHAGAKSPGHTAAHRRPRRSLLASVRHTWLLRWIDPHVIRRPRAYVGQAVMAGAVLAVVLMAQDLAGNQAIVAAVAGSVAMVFVMPHSQISSPYRIIGGHTIAVAVSYAVVGLSLLFPGSMVGTEWFMDLIAASAVGITVLLMSSTNTEHMPAAAASLALSINKTPINAVLFILSAAVLVATTRVVLKRHLHNLI